MYVSIYTCMYVCMHAYMYTCMYVCSHVCTRVCMHACMHACMHVCMHTYIHPCMYVCVHACMHECMDTCTCRPLRDSVFGTTRWVALAKHDYAACFARHEFQQVHVQPKNGLNFVPLWSKCQPGTKIKSIF